MCYVLRRYSLAWRCVARVLEYCYRAEGWCTCAMAISCNCTAAQHLSLYVESWVYYCPLSSLTLWCSPDSRTGCGVTLSLETVITRLPLSSVQHSQASCRYVSMCVMCHVMSCHVIPLAVSRDERRPCYSLPVNKWLVPRPDRPVHPSVHFGPVRPSWTEDWIYVSFIFYKTPQSATCRNPAPPPLVCILLILLLFLYLFNKVSLHLPPLVSCIVIFYFPSLITSISHHLCLVLFFFNQQCGKVQCTMRNAGDW